MASTLFTTVSVAIAVLAGAAVMIGLWWSSRTSESYASPRAEAMRALAVIIFLVATGVSLL